MDTVTVGGVSIPALGLGTWPMRGNECRAAVASAIDLGYRHFDTAQLYENERAVGAAIDESDVPREEFFLVTKIRRDNLAADAAIRSVRASHDRLGTTIDLLLIHAPSRSVPIAETIEAMNQLQTEGIVDHIGVSNFSIEQLEHAISVSETPVVTNQVEYHPYQRRDELLAYCLEHDVMLTAYTPLARGRVLGDETLAEIGERYGKSAAQITLRWLVQQEHVSAIPKAATRAHQAENIDIFDVSLTSEEMERIFNIEETILDRLRGLLGFEP